MLNYLKKVKFSSFFHISRKQNQDFIHIIQPKQHIEKINADANVYKYATLSFKTLQGMAKI